MKSRCLRGVWEVSRGVWEVSRGVWAVLKGFVIGLGMY